MAALHAASFVTPRPWSEAEITELLDSRFSFALTRPGGFLLGRVVAGEAELLTLAVDPAARGSGLGGALLGEFMKEAQRRGAVQAFLEVAADNATAIRLYLRQGFTNQGRRRDYFAAADGTRSDAIVMTRSF